MKENSTTRRSSAWNERRITRKKTFLLQQKKACLLCYPCTVYWNWTNWLERQERHVPVALTSYLCFSSYSTPVMHRHPIPDFLRLHDCTLLPVFLSSSFLCKFTEYVSKSLDSISWSISQDEDVLYCSCLVSHSKSACIFLFFPLSFCHEMLLISLEDRLAVCARNALSKSISCPSFSLHSNVDLLLQWILFVRETAKNRHHIKDSTQQHLQ